MIRISDINHVSDFIKSRAASMWVRRLKSADPSIIIYRVRPYGTKENRGKHPRIVSVNEIEDWAECVSRWTGEICEANADFVPGQPDVPKTPHLCAHVYRALQAIAAISGRKVA
jgi:hypothetical protein